MKNRLLFVLPLAFALSACASMSPTQQRTLSGAAIGTAGGAVVGAIAGDAGLGAVIGAGVGAASGFIYDKHKQAEQRSYEQGYAAGQTTPAKR